MSQSKKRRGVRLSLQVRPEERDRLTELAAERGVKVSTLVRAWIAEAIEREDGQPARAAPESPAEMRTRVLESAFRAAEAGDVQAMKMVLAELRRADPPEKPSGDEDDGDQGGKVLPLASLRARAAKG